jgi:SAM-dependent methyltransferase
MQKFLDIGCGPGTINNLGYYEKFRNEFEIYGIDFLKKNITTIKKRFPKGHFTVANAQKLPFPSNTFDYIMSRHVLEHVEDLHKVVSEMSRVGKKGSTLLIAVPHAGLERILIKIIPHYLEEGHHHQRVFDKKMLVTVLKKNGFKVTSLAQQKWPMFLVVVILSFLSRLSGKISMEEQSGIFTVQKKNYLHNKKMYPLYKIIFSVLMFTNTIFSFLNNFIPFEIEIYAKKI